MSNSYTVNLLAPFLADYHMGPRLLGDDGLKAVIDDDKSKPLTRRSKPDLPLAGRFRQDVIPTDTPAAPPHPGR